MTPGTSMIAAPQIIATTDKYTYRKKVRMWMRRVRVFANGGYNRAKGVSNGYVHAFYAAVNESYVKVVETELLNNNLKMDPQDDDEQLTFDQHCKVVEKILFIVAKDLTADLIRRMITLKRYLLNCKRKDGESFQTFAERFRGVEQSYLNCLKRQTTQQEKQHSALVMLENAGLPDTIYNNIIVSLVSKVKQDRLDENEEIPVKIHKLLKVKRCWKTLCRTLRTEPRNEIPGTQSLKWKLNH